MVFSSLGFTVSAHLCGGNKVLTAIGFVKTELSCGMKKTNNKCPNSNHIRTICCQNIFDYHHMEEGTEKNKPETEISSTDLAGFPVEITKTKIVKPQVSPFYTTPPNRVENIILHTQSFLI